MLWSRRRRPTSRPPPRLRPDLSEQDSPDETGSAYRSHLELTFDEPSAPDPASQGLVRSARRLLRRKERTAAGQFLAEGRQASAEALATPGVVSTLLVADDAVDRHQDLLNVAVRAGVPIGAVPAAVLHGLADTVTPQGVIAICRRIDVPLADALADGSRLIVFCEQIRDPGNLGTVIRCADAFGADGVIVSRESVDLYNAKTVRATTGSLFHLPVVVEADLADAAAYARGRGVQVFGADGCGLCTVDDLRDSGELARPTLWVLGNEAHGFGAGQLAQLDRTVGLQLYGRAESLNLSTAAAVLLYASATAQRG